ncbi:MAG: 2-oxo acid dehydrogenase subunit E2, partial [Acidobacteriia bacterium]|nr:2-oxo acid dehydrogenase subunit E2 [Terriglobia bacterium]
SGAHGKADAVGSVPRLMPGQGAIIATGAIDYPAEYRGASPEVTAMLGIGKVMMITCTYDHRIIQGAESGLFLAQVQALLQGEARFYDELFADLRRMNVQPQVEKNQLGFSLVGGQRIAAEDGTPDFL